MSLRSVKVELRPNYIENELRRYLNTWLRRSLRTHMFMLDDLAEEALEHIVSRAFLAGKIEASRETGTPWQIVGDDSQVIDRTADKFKADFEKIMSDTRYDIILDGDSDWNRVDRRLQILAQLLTWKSFNLGKVSEFKRSLHPSSIFMAANYKYEGFFMLETQADERVCFQCAPCAGTLSENPDDILGCLGLTDWEEWPPHIGCRCKIVGRPTVPIFEEQDRFREKWVEEMFLQQEEAFMV